MKRICFFPAAFIFFGFAVSFAQDTISFWKKGGNVGLNITQVALSNWAGGGQNTIGITGLTNVLQTMPRAKLLGIILSSSATV